jgi:hypothetical protein
VLLSPRGADWGAPLFKPATLGVGNGFAAITAAPPEFLTLRVPPVGGVAAPISFPDAFLPYSVGVQVSSTFYDGAFEGLWRTFIGGPALGNIAARSRAQVNQVSLATPQLFPERVMLLLDFSKAMRLRYTGDEGSGQGKSGIAVLHDVAQTVISDFSETINLGVLMFSDGTRTTPVDLLGAQDANKKDAQENHLNSAKAAVERQRTEGDGTDIADAINKGVSMLNAAADSYKLGSGVPDFLIGGARMILVTDGEPNRGGVSSTSDLATQVAEASERAKTAMSSAWASGIQSNVLFMQREHHDDDLAAREKAFMMSISGANKGAEPNNYMPDGGNPNKLLSYLDNIRQTPRCRFDSLDALPQGAVPRWDLPRGRLSNARARDVIRGYFTLDAGSGATEIMVPPENTFIDDDEGFKAFVLSPEGGVLLDPKTNLVSVDDLKNSKLMAFLYRSSDRTVWLTGMLCAAMASTKQNAGLRMRFNMRWGAPHLLDPNTRTSF